MESKTTERGKDNGITSVIESIYFEFYFLLILFSSHSESFRWRWILSVGFKWRYTWFTSCTYAFYFSDSLYIVSIGDTLEIAAQCAITMGDIPSFERALAQLKPFYFDLKYVLKNFIIYIVYYSIWRDRVPESPNYYHLLGLNLLCLLSQNRLADFHTVENFRFEILEIIINSFRNWNYFLRKRFKIISF